MIGSLYQDPYFSPYQGRPPHLILTNLVRNGGYLESRPIEFLEAHTRISDLNDRWPCAASKTLCIWAYICRVVVPWMAEG